MFFSISIDPTDFEISDLQREAIRLKESRRLLLLAILSIRLNFNEHQGGTFIKTLIISLFLLLISLRAYSFGSLCGHYDVQNIPADEVRTSLILKCMHDRDTLYLDGAIDNELIFELRNFAEVPIRILFLNSTGGKVEDAIEVAKFIRENKITTVLRPGAKCLSACTLLFQAGWNRVAHPSAILMFHSARFLRQRTQTIEKVRRCQTHPNEDCTDFIASKTKVLKEITDDLFSAYESYGASPQLYQDYKKRPLVSDWIDQGNYLKMSNWYMTAEQALKYNITTQIIEEVDIASAESSF